MTVYQIEITDDELRVFAGIIQKVTQIKLEPKKAVRHKLQVYVLNVLKKERSALNYYQIQEALKKEGRDLNKKAIQDALCRLYAKKKIKRVAQGTYICG